eukprot:gene1100-1653_t
MTWSKVQKAKLRAVRTFSTCITEGVENSLKTPAARKQGKEKLIEKLQGPKLLQSLSSTEKTCTTLDVLSAPNTGRRCLDALKVPAGDRSKKQLAPLLAYMTNIFEEHKLQPSQKVELVQALRYEEYNAGDYIINMGDIGEKYYIILFGKVGMYRPNAQHIDKVMKEEEQQRQDNEAGVKAALIASAGKVTDTDGHSLNRMARRSSMSIMTDLKDVVESAAKPEHRLSIALGRSSRQGEQPKFGAQAEPDPKPAEPVAIFHEQLQEYVPTDMAVNSECKCGEPAAVTTEGSGTARRGQERLDFLRSQHMFKSFRESELLTISQFLREGTLSPGERVWSAGDAVTKAFLLKEGACTIQAAVGPKNKSMDISQVSAPRLLGAVEILNKLEKYPFGLTTKSACSFFFIMKQEFLQLPMKVVKNILADNINLAEHLASRRESIQKTLSKQPKNLLQAPRWQKTALERVAAGENLKENDNELIHPNPPQFPEDSTAVALQIVNGRTVEFKYGSPEASTAKVRPIDPEPARAGVIRYMLKYYDTPGATLIHPPPRDQDPSYIDEEGSSNRVLKDPLHGREKEYIPRRHRLREGNFTALRHRRAEAQVYTPPVARIIPADAPGRWPTSPAKPGASARKPESPVKQPKVAESEEALQRFIARSGDLSTGGDQPAPADSGAHVKRSSSRSSDALASDAHTLVLKRVRGASLSTSESGEPAEAPQSTKAAKDLTRSVEVHMHSSLLDDHPKKRKRFVSLRNTVKGIVLAGKLRRFIAGAKRKWGGDLEGAPARVSKDRDEEQVTPALASIADAEDEAASSEPGEFEFESPTNRSPQPDVEASTSVMKADQFDVEMVGRDEADRGDVGMVGRDDADRDDVRMVGRDEATRLSRASREPRISSQSDAPAAAEKVDPDEGKPKRMPRRSQPAAIGRRAAEKPRRRDFREKRISMQLEVRRAPPAEPFSMQLETMSATAGSPAAVDPSPEWMGKRFYKGREANSSYGYMFKSENDYFKARKSKLPTVEVSRLDIPSQLQNLGVNLGNPLVLHTESAREHSPPSTTESSELLTADRTMKKCATSLRTPPASTQAHPMRNYATSLHPNSVQPAANAMVPQTDIEPNGLCPRAGAELNDIRRFGHLMMNSPDMLSSVILHSETSEQFPTIARR